MPAAAWKFAIVIVQAQVGVDPKLFNIADQAMFPGLGDTLKTMLDQLERCQKALADFLEQKRSAMPRFYFIGDDDLLEILGQAKNPTVIQVCNMSLRLDCSGGGWDVELPPPMEAHAWHVTVLRIVSCVKHRPT